MFRSTERVVLRFLEDMGGSRALSVAIMLRYKDFEGLSALELDPRHHVTALSYFRYAAATSLLKKLRGVTESTDAKSRALRKWSEGEADCYRTNQRLVRYLPEFSNSADRDDRIASFLKRARKVVESWIGSAPPDDISGRFGPGATYSDRGLLSTVADKMTANPTFTPSSVMYLCHFVGTKWASALTSRGGKVVSVPGNRLLTVPKNSKIRRVIAAEPSLNIFYQLGLGQALRRRLRNATGWDLDRAQEIHRQVAEESSKTREFCTLDLSNASDTVCRNLVKLLLPSRWYEELDALRSPKTQVEGAWRVLEKFSSMGNGYTFELETIIFSALLVTAVRDCGGLGELGSDVFVFGDDLILPDQFAHSVIPMLRFFGFSINQEKSFFGAVPFRESCGADFFDGSDVRPFYLKEVLDEPPSVVAAVNGIKRNLDKLEALGLQVNRTSWFLGLDLLPREFRHCRGPTALGDVVIHDREEFWTIKLVDGIRYFRTVQVHGKPIPWHHWTPPVVLACALYGYGDGRTGVLPRSPILSYRVAWVPYS